MRIGYMQIPGRGKWWKLRMLHGPEIPRVHSTDLAVSRWSSTLYMTGQNTHDLFSINLDKVREVPGTASRVRCKFFFFPFRLSRVSTVYMMEQIFVARISAPPLLRIEISTICSITNTRHDRRISLSWGIPNWQKYTRTVPSMQQYHVISVYF